MFRFECMKSAMGRQKIEHTISCERHCHPIQVVMKFWVAQHKSMKTCGTEVSGPDKSQGRFKVVEASIRELQVQGVGLGWPSAQAIARPLKLSNSFAGPAD
jgi:hypothetical protein